jgi:hypothetical protein
MWTFSEISLVLNAPLFPQAQAAAGVGAVHARAVHHIQDANELFDAGMSVFCVISICECRGADIGDPSPRDEARRRVSA